MLDPPITEGGGPSLDAAAPTGASLNTPAKIDPTLPGNTHPAQRGTPGLDTIEETSTAGGTPGSQGSSQGPANATTASQGQIPGPGSASTPGNGVGTRQAPTPAASQGLAPALASTSTPGDSGASNSATSETDGAGDANAERTTRRPSYVAALMATPTNTEGDETWKESTGEANAGSAEQTAERKGADMSAQSAAGTGADGGDALGFEPEEAQYGVHKIPGNPPFESDEDEDEQEHDMSHHEGFLRAMPEDERGMRVLKLPDGRVRRVDDDDEETSAQPAADEADATAPSQAAPSSAQAPPLSFGTVQPPTGTAPSAPSEAPGPSVIIPGASVVLPPANEGTALLSRENSGSLSSAIEGSSIVTVTGSSTPGTVSPSGMLVPGTGTSGSTFTIVGAADPAFAPMDKPTAVTVPTCTGSDPGVLSPPVEPSEEMQRARSCSPADRGPEVLGAVGLPPITPAPPRPGAPIDVLEPQAKFHSAQLSDVQGTRNGLSQEPGVTYEGESPHCHAVHADQEVIGLLSGTVGLGGMQTEIKIANLQGPEQEIMGLVMHTRVDGRLQEVEFDFNLDYDHPDEVGSGPFVCGSVGGTAMPTSFGVKFREMIGQEDVSGSTVVIAVYTRCLPK